MSAPPATLTHRNLRGFTLVEMLAVVAVIGILAALIFPGFKSLIACGRETKCQSNLRQIGAAAFAYAADNDGYFPPGVSWVAKLGPYTSSNTFWGYAGPAAPACLVNTVFECPEMYNDKDLLGARFVNFRSYAWNIHMGNGDAYVGQKMVKIPTPSKVCMIADAFHGSQLNNSPINLGIRHNGKANVLFVDGHVEAREFTTTFLSDYTYKDPFWGVNY